MTLVIEGMKKLYRVFEINQENYENGFQTLTVKGMIEDSDPCDYLTWTEVWKYKGTHDIFYLLREEKGEHGALIHDNRIYNKYIPKLATCVKDTFYDQLLKYKRRMLNV